MIAPTTRGAELLYNNYIWQFLHTYAAKLDPTFSSNKSVRTLGWYRSCKRSTFLAALSHVRARLMRYHLLTPWLLFKVIFESLFLLLGVYVQVYLDNSDSFNSESRQFRQMFGHWYHICDFISMLRNSVIRTIADAKISNYEWYKDPWIYSCNGSMHPSVCACLTKMEHAEAALVMSAKYKFTSLIALVV